MAQTTAAPTTTTTSTSPVPDTHIALSLPPGIASTSATFEAPDPATHYFDVLVVFPTDTVLRIHFTTADGIDLRILSQEDMYSTWCLNETGLMRCLMHFPILEARQAGIWTAVVDKLSGPPAEGTIDISWMSLQPPVSG